MSVTGKDLAFAKKMYEKLEERRGEGTAVSFALIKEGELIAAAAAGTRDGNPENQVSVGDMFNIGSVSKMYCTMAIMQLVEKGLVDLETPVYKYLPRFKMLKDERYKDITVRMCLNHSSGLPGTCYWMGFSCAFDDAELLKDHYYDCINKAMLKDDPGAYSVYCNDGFIIAQLIIEELTKMSYTEYVQKNITGPIGAVSTCSGLNNPDHRALVKMPNMAPEQIMIVGTGGISTDMIDCARFGWEFIKPGKIFTKESVDRTAELQCVKYNKRHYKGIDVTYGLGWDNVSLEIAGRDFSYGPGTLSKGGTTLQFGSHLTINRELGISIAMSATQDCKIKTTELSAEIVADYLGKSFEGSKMPEKKPLPAGFAEKFSGIYYNQGSSFVVEIKDDCLTVSAVYGPNKTEVVKDAPFVGDCFWFEKDRSRHYLTEGEGGICYYSQYIDLGICTFGEKPVVKGTFNEAWRKRDGKRFFICNANAYDSVAGRRAASLKVVINEETGMVDFAQQGDGKMPTALHNL
jgi:CubicO group peptidase (beta-lactamase class C family)